MTQQLERLQAAWLELFLNASEIGSIDGERLAGPFITTTHRDYGSDIGPRILYVGKATAGDFGRTCFLQNPTLTERRAFATNFLHDEVLTGSYRSGFWKFAHEASALAASHSAAPVAPLQNMIWSNISKIGVRSNNPQGSYLAFQASLALETLEAEIAAYSPEVILLVTHDYGEDVVCKLFDDPHKRSWQKEREQDGVWWRPAIDGLPPVVWTYHPERKGMGMRAQWLKCLEGVLANL